MYALERILRHKLYEQKILKGLSSSVPEVQDLVGKIAVRAKDAWGEMNSQELSMCLHGM